MKRFSLFLAMSIFAFFGVNSLIAQTSIANGLVKVSDESNEYWYYIENGHTSVNVLANADGRFGALITSNGGHGAGVKASIDMMHPNADRAAQRWKVVAVPDDAGFYYLINQKGEYFHQYGGIAYGDTEANVPDLTANGAKFAIDTWTSSSYYTSIKVKGAGYNLVGQNGGGANAWDLVTPTSAGGNTTMTFGTTANPRSWRFVPIEELDEFYPTIYPQGTDVADMTEWFFIKSLNPEQAAAPYLTVNGTALQLSADKTAAAVYGFVKGGKATTGNPSNGGPYSLIIPKADITKYVNTAGVSATSYNWWLKHVIAPAMSSTPQATITSGRAGTSYSFLTGASNVAAMQAANATNTGDNATVSTYDNQYAWTYEKAYVVDVEATGITITNPAAATAYVVEQGSPFSLSFTLNEYFELPADGVSIDGVPVTPTEVGGTYTVELASVTAATTHIKIEAIVSAVVPSTLSEITIDGVSLDEFDAETTDYVVVLPSNATGYPTIGYTKTDEGANVAVTYNPESFNPVSWNTAVITVTGAPTTTIYKVNFHTEAVLPASADTDVRNGMANRSAESDLLVQYSNSATYVRRAYLEFNPSTVDMTEHNRVVLQLAVKSLQTGKSGNPTIEVRTVPESFASIETMTFASNAETVVAQGDKVSADYVIPVSTPDKTIVEVDVTDYIKDNADKTSLRLQVSGVAPYDGNMLFYSIEGSVNADDLALMPMLVLYRNPAVSIGVDANINIVSPVETGPFVVQPGDDFELKFTVSNGYAPVVKVNGSEVDEAQLTKSGETYTLLLSNIVEDVEISIVATPTTNSEKNLENQTKISVIGNNLQIQTVEMTSIEVYTLLGSLVAKQNVQGTISLTLDKGVYLVKTANQTYKVKL